MNDLLYKVLTHLQNINKSKNLDAFYQLKASNFDFSFLNTEPSYVNIILNGAIKEKFNDYFFNLHQVGVNLFLKDDENDSTNKTPLHTAASVGNFEVMNYILSLDEAKNFIDTKNYYDETPLFLAVKENHSQIVKLLLENKANYLEKAETGRTPLTQAIRQGTIETIKPFLEIKGLNKFTILNELIQVNNTEAKKVAQLIQIQFEKEELEKLIDSKNKALKKLKL